MARDYAPRNRAPRRSSGSKKKSSGGGWTMLILGLSIGLAVAAFVYTQRPTPVIVQAPPEAPAEGGGRSDNGKVKIPPKEKPRFTFYELLPGQEVVVPPDAKADTAARPEPRSADKPATANGQPTGPATPAAPADTAPATGTYLIQVASFRSEAEADEQKAQLALIGVEARIEKVTIDNKDTYYRVRIGPVSSLQRAQATLAQLESNGINGLLVRLK